MNNMRTHWQKAAIGLGVMLVLAGCGPSEPVTQGGPIELRRLTEDQYRQSVADIFGADIKVAGRFDPEIRTDGLLAVGSSGVTVTPAGFEQYHAMARNIAAQVLDDKHRDALVPCKPAAANAPDDACATKFLNQFGRLIFRRPLTQAELQAEVGVSAAATRTLGNFYSGLEFGLAGLLEAPEFIFRVDTSESDPSSPSGLRLSAYSKASRLSFLLWNTTPDDTLLTAAEHGDLNNKDGLARQADRLLASPRVTAGVRAFFSDFLGFDAFDELAKDTVIYPKYSLKVGIDAKEQTLRTVTDHLVTRDADYRDLFTTRHTFMTRALGMIYRVPVSSRDWQPVDFPKDDPRAGLLTELSFVALHSHPGRSSATLRGKAVRELLLCQPVPAPPNNVNFALVQDTNNPKFKTARERLTAHRTEATCAGCHKIMDPIGLALENFDGLGQVRAQENGAPIDASGELDGIAFKDAAGLGQAMHDDPAASSCLVDSTYRYAVGRRIDPGEKQWLGWLEGRFAADGYRLPQLLRRIATSNAFYSISAPRGSAPTQALDGAASPAKGG